MYRGAIRIGIKENESKESNFAVAASVPGAEGPQGDQIRGAIGAQFHTTLVHSSTQTDVEATLPHLETSSSKCFVPIGFMKTLSSALEETIRLYAPGSLTDDASFLSSIDALLLATARYMRIPRHLRVTLHGALPPGAESCQVVVTYMESGHSLHSRHTSVNSQDRSGTHMTISNISSLMESQMLKPGESRDLFAILKCSIQLEVFVQSRLGVWKSETAALGDMDHKRSLIFSCPESGLHPVDVSATCELVVSAPDGSAWQFV